MEAGEGFEAIGSKDFVARIVLNKADAVVKVTNPWHGTSQIICKSVRALAAQYRSIKFFIVDSHDEPTLAAIYRIDTLPTLLFFKEGTLVDKLAGLVQPATISERVQALSNTSNTNKNN